MAKVKKTGTAVANWDQELANAAMNQEAARSTGGGGKFIGTRGAVFAYDGDEIGQDMNVVVIDYVNENQYYDPDEAYDPENPQSPICFAFARSEDELAPHTDSPKPQHEQCGGCPQNAFGSAGKGRKGKACKNVMRLACITEGALEEGAEGIASTDVAYLKVSTTNVKHFSKYLEQLKDANRGKVRPSWAVVCKMHIKPNRDTQIELGFNRGEDINDGDLLTALKAKVAEQREKTMFPYQQSTKEEQQEAPKGKFTRKGR